MSNQIEKWLQESEENRKVYAQEGLILEATEGVWEALERRAWNKKQLAAALGTSRAYVTQLLNGSRNMTLRTLSDIALSLGMRVSIRFCDEPQASVWKDEGTLSVTPQQNFQAFGDIRDVTAANDWVSLLPVDDRKSA